MYTRYFGLIEKPFTISPNPRNLYMSELYSDALAHLLYGINRDDGCIVILTGDIGTGKTTICRSLLAQLPKNTDNATIVNPNLTTQELLHTICEEFRIPIHHAKPTFKTYIDLIYMYLLIAHAKGRNSTIVIDEAQNLSVDVLEQLRLLTNFETNTQKLLRIVLIGQPELGKLLETKEMTQLNQRVTSRFHLKPLKTQEVATYIQHRICLAGGGRAPLFTNNAIKHISKISQGIPRVINILCDRALIGAYAENADYVGLRIMKSAVREVCPVQPKRQKQIIHKVLLTAVASLFLGIVSTYFLQHYFKENLFHKSINTISVRPLLLKPGPQDQGPKKRSAEQLDTSHTENLTSESKLRLNR